MGQKKIEYDIWEETPKVGDQLYGWVYTYLETDCGDLDRIHLVQDRAQWRVLLNILQCRDQLSD
jgi:hypothetical protein